VDLDPELLGEIYYWKRWSSRPMLSTAFHSEFLEVELLARLEPGDTGAVLDGSGRLRGFRRVFADSAPGESTPDVALVFELMGLDPEDYSAADRSNDDTSFEWERRSGEGPVSIRAEFRGSFLSELDSGTDHVNTAETFLRASRLEPLPFLVTAAFLLLPLLLAVFLAWRNLRAGRSDRRGANLFAGVVFVGYMIQSMLAMKLGSMPAGTFLNRLIGDAPFGHALYHSAMVWVQYIAIEPYLRRVRPAALVSWARMVSHRWKDPILGRDVLAGLFLGATMVALQFAAGRALLSFEGKLFFREILDGGRETGIASATNALAGWAYAVAFAAPAVMLLMVIYILLVLVLRREALAIGAIPVLAVVPAMFFGLDTPLWFNATQGLLVAGALLIAVIRFGVLAGVMVMFTLLLANSLPWALNPAAWYGPVTMMTPILLSVLAVWAGMTALGDRAGFKELLGEGRADGAQ
jgi:hypothetical protein